MAKHPSSSSPSDPRSGDGAARSTETRRKQAVSTASSYAKYSGLGIQMILILGLFTYGGYRLDEYLHSDPWGTVVGSLLGVGLALYVPLRQLTK